MYCFQIKLILDVRLCSEYASEFSCKRILGWWGTNIPNRHEKSTKNQSVTEWYRYGKCGTIDRNVECSCCHEVEAVEYFELLGMKYGDLNAIIQRVK